MDKLYTEDEIFWLLELERHEELTTQVKIHIEYGLPMCAPLVAYALDLIERKPRKRKARSPEIFLRNAKIACSLHIEKSSDSVKKLGETSTTKVAEEWHVDEKTVRNAATQHKELVSYLQHKGELTESIPDEDALILAMIEVSSVLQIREWLYTELGARILAKLRSEKERSEKR